jgi:hypothetical protein
MGKGLGFLLGAVLVVMVAAACFQRSALYAQPAESGPSIEGALIAMSASAGDRQQITVIDPRQRTMCVYHVSSATGDIVLRSARNLRWDLLMEAYNTGSPTPQELQTLFQSK